MMFLALVLACVRVEHDFTETLSSEGIEVLAADLDRGDLSYDVDDELAFHLRGSSWGRGGGQKKALSRESGNDYGIDVDPGVLDLWARAELRKAGVDFDVTGPSFLHLDLLTREGTVYVEDVTGSHVITATRVEATRLAGDADLLATDRGMDVEIWPYDDGVIRLDSTGDDVVLALPFGADYDIQVWGDAEHGLEVTDLGFDNMYLAPDYFAGSRGSEAIDVKVYVTGGSFTLLESL